MSYDEKIQALAHFLQTPEGEESLIKLLKSVDSVAEVHTPAFLTPSISLVNQLFDIQRSYLWIEYMKEVSETQNDVILKELEMQ